MKKVPGFKTIAEGFVSLRKANTPTAVAAGSRQVVTTRGEIVCSFNVQAALGLNDFNPMLARSSDGGMTWEEQGLIWPHLQEKWAIFGSISRSPGGELFYYGAWNPITAPGESFWSEATQGLLANELIWARSGDDGRTWTEPTVIPMPIPGAAEAPGAMCLARNGDWHVCYSPYNTFDPDLVVDRNQVVVMSSSDQGATWRHTSMMRFGLPHATAAEAWVIELADGRLLGACWNLNQKDGSDFPNAYALSNDRGRTWTPARSTGIMGQSIALTPLPDGRALLIYNQRKHGEVGVWLAAVRPTETDFGIQSNEVIWRAPATPQTKSDTGHADWVGFSFGEPSVTVLPDGTLFATLWSAGPAGNGIRFVKLKEA